MNGMQKKTVGLIKGRHDMPVDEYIFDEIENIFDFNQQYKTADRFLLSNHVEELTVYVTGLTSVTVSVINACYDEGVKLTLMHYDRDTDTYIPQAVFK